MSNLQFEDDYQGQNYSFDNTQKGMVGWLVKKGIAPTQKVAEIILIAAAISFFALSIYFFRRNSTPDFQATDINEEFYTEEF